MVVDPSSSMWLLRIVLPNSMSIQSTTKKMDLQHLRIVLPGLKALEKKNP